MVKFERQHNLFKNNEVDISEKNLGKDIFINKKIIKEWQEKIMNHQSQIFKYGIKNINQTSLFKSDSSMLNESLNPMDLTPLPLNFWKWPKSMHEGPAIYFVMDNMTDLDKNIILYIGETISADKRWKGEHDCKNYLSNYSDSLQKANITTRLNIRFWLDVPIKTKERRQIEHNLIQTWLPPFNKETREIWATPFTSQINW